MLNCHGVFRAQEVWFLTENNDFKNRRLEIGCCPFCDNKIIGLFQTNKKNGNAPMTKIQLESALAYCAALCIRYKINPRYCMTHYEFGILYPKSSSRGKIDITYLPCYPNVKSYEVGDFLRQKIKWYILKLTNLEK